MFDQLFEKLEVDRIKEAHKLGSCMLFAENEVKRLLNTGVSDFKVIEGYVYFYNDEDNSAEHTWIEFSDGTKIDDTINQFEHWGMSREDVKYLPSERKEYTPQQYLDLCQEFPAEK